MPRQKEPIANADLGELLKPMLAGSKVFAKNTDGKARPKGATPVT